MSDKYRVLFECPEGDDDVEPKEFAVVLYADSEQDALDIVRTSINSTIYAEEYSTEEVGGGLSETFGGTL